MSADVMYWVKKGEVYDWDDERATEDGLSYDGEFIPESLIEFMKQTEILIPLSDCPSRDKIMTQYKKWRVSDE